MTAPHISTYWHDHYIHAARTAYPDVCADFELAVGWKITRPDGTTRGGYYWPLVNGDHDLPVLHTCDEWDVSNDGSCPWREGDGFCFVTTHAGPASSGGIWLTGSTGHVVVYAPELARSDQPGKHRAPWLVDVDCFDPVELIRDGLCGASLVDARLDGARLDGARLVDASLDGASLDGASLDGASLVGASLVGARLDGARLDGARLDGASLDGASLVGATCDRYTAWPTGFDWRAAGVILR